MICSIVWTAVAKRQLTHAYDYYCLKELSLGERFLVSVKARLAVIARYPESCPIYQSDIRKRRLKEFPYFIYYIFDQTKTGGRIRIMRIVHTRRLAA